MPHTVCSECLGHKYVCIYCHRPHPVVAGAGKAYCDCRVIDGQIYSYQRDRFLGEYTGDGQEEVCTTCKGTGVEDLHLDEARRYLRGAA